MKKIISFILFLLTVSASQLTVIAMDNNIEIPSFEDEVDVQFEATVPEGFDYDIEIYLNRSAYYMTYESGYSMNISLIPDEYEVKTIIDGDIYDNYVTTHDDFLTVPDDTEFYISVSESESAANPEDWQDDYSDGHIETYELETIPDPLLLDFSNGKEYGTLLITSEMYSAIDSATFRIVGPERTYDIPLSSDYFFKAEVRLPAGDYYESSTIDVDLSEYASMPEDYHFLWQHKDKPGIWGNYYNIKSGETCELDDLVIYISTGSETFEVSSNLLFSGTWTHNLLEAQERDRQKELESAFPEIYGTSETETIAEAQPVEPSADYRNIIQIAIIAISVLTVLGIAVAIIRKRKS